MRAAQGPQAATHTLLAFTFAVTKQRNQFHQRRSTSQGDKYKMASHPRTRTAVRPAGSQLATPNASHGSQTITQTNAGPSTPSATLRLRAEPEERPRVQWAEDVVDNEGMGKKSSKVCCIYHKPHEPGDSDCDSSSSSDEDSDSEPDLSRAHKAGGDGKGKRSGRRHQHDDDCGGEKGKGKERKPSPNAYERQPRQKSKNAG